MARRNKLQILRDLVDEKVKQADSLFSNANLEKVIALFNQISKKIDQLSDDRQKVLKCVDCDYVEKVYFFAPNKQECPKCGKWMTKSTEKKNGKGENNNKN